MNDASKRRVDLWLRAERALGLESVAVSPLLVNADQSDSAEQRKSEKPQPPVEVVKSDAKATATTPKFFESEVVGGQGLTLPQADQAAFTAPPLSRDEKILALKSMDEGEVKGCTRCRLCETRTKTVFGEGDADAKIFFIGEGPGENEDLTGRPFVGRAGELLTRMIIGMGLAREQVFIANIVKCRPPGNRTPALDEVATCTPYLVRQLEIIRPQAIVTLGLPSAKYMLNSKLAMGKLRGVWQSWRGIPLMPTFHPAYLLRAYTDENRAAVWSDLKQVLTRVGLPVPKARS